MMEDNIQLLEDKNQLIDNLQTSLSNMNQHIRMQTAYIALLESALKQYNIILDVRDNQITTRVVTKVEDIKK